MGANTIECCSCKGKTTKCQKCNGTGKLRNEKNLKSIFVKIEDKVIVGKHTSKVPSDLFFSSYGINLHESDQPLEEDVCPDRRDLVDASQKIEKQMAIGKKKETSTKLYYIIGSIDCKFWTNYGNDNNEKTKSSNKLSKNLKKLVRRASLSQ